MISGFLDLFSISFPPIMLSTAAVAISVRGQSEFTEILYYLNSSLIPNTHKLIPNLAIE